VRLLARAACLTEAETGQRAAIEGQERTTRRLAQLAAHRGKMRDEGGMTIGAVQQALMMHGNAHVRAAAQVTIVPAGEAPTLPAGVWRRVFFVPGETEEAPGHFVALRRILTRAGRTEFRADAREKCWAEALWLMSATPASVDARASGRGKTPRAFPGAMQELGMALAQRPEGTLWDWYFSANEVRYCSPTTAEGRGKCTCACCKHDGGRINGCGTAGGHACRRKQAGSECRREVEATGAADRLAAGDMAAALAAPPGDAAHAVAPGGGADGPVVPALLGGVTPAPLERIPTLLTIADDDVVGDTGEGTTALRAAPRYRLSGAVNQGVVLAAARRFLDKLQATGCFGTRKVDEFHAGFLEALTALTEARKTANEPAASADAPGELRQAARDEADAAQVAEATGRPVAAVCEAARVRRERVQRRRRVERFDRRGDVGQGARALESKRLDGAEALRVVDDQVTRCGRASVAAVPPLAEDDEAEIQAVLDAPWVAPDKRAVSELAETIRDVARRCKRGTAAGHFGPVPDLLHRAIRAEPQMAWTLAAVFLVGQRVGLPVTMAAAVAAVVESKDKARVLSPPEAVVRLFDKAMIAAHKSDWRGCEALSLSHAHSRHGAPAAGVTAQTLVAGGWTMYKFDLRKGYNARGVRRMMRDARRLGLTPGESRYFAAVLERRALLVRGTDGLQRVELADGRGGPQGLPFLPWVFSAGTCAFVEAALVAIGTEATRVVAMVYIIRRCHSAGASDGGRGRHSGTAGRF